MLTNIFQFNEISEFKPIVSKFLNQFEQKPQFLIEFIHQLIDKTDHKFLIQVTIYFLNLLEWNQTNIDIIFGPLTTHLLSKI